jgi:hypothetical protein
MYFSGFLRDDLGTLSWVGMRTDKTFSFLSPNSILSAMASYLAIEESICMATQPDRRNKENSKEIVLNIFILL